MARLTGCLPLLSFVVFFISCVEGAHLQLCHRVFPLQLTAAAMPCRYICAYYSSYAPHYRVRAEDDGTFCHKHGAAGVCWNGQCLTRYGDEDQWSQQADAASKVPLRIRKRDVSTATKGAVVSKTVESKGGSSTTTKTVNVVKTVNTSTGSEGTKTGGATGLKGHYMTGFTQDQADTGVKTGMPTMPTVDVDPFAVNNGHSGSQTTQTFFSRGTESPHMSKTVRNGDLKITVRRGPNGEKITTRTVRKYVITRGPTKTVRRLIITRGSAGGVPTMMQTGGNEFATKTVKVSFSRGAKGGTGGITAGGQADLSRKTSQITTTHRTNIARKNPISSIVRTINQESILGGQNIGGASTGAKSVSTLAVTKSVHPSVSVVQVTKQAVTPLAAPSSGTSNPATLRGVEVEVPGYTAGLRHNWKWVLARRVGVYPPYVQTLDPDVLFYKLGLRKPNLPSLPGPVLNILNRVPVHPVGSDLYGYLLSSKILEKIRGFTDGVNGLTKLTSMLSTTNTSNEDNSNLLKSLFTGTESSPSGSILLQKLLLATMSGTGNNPLNTPYSTYLESPYGVLFGRTYAGPYNTPLASFLGGPFAESSWPFDNRLQQLRRFGLNPSLNPRGPLGSYDSSGSPSSSRGLHYRFSEDGKLVPTSESRESSIKSLLASITSGSDTMGGRYGPSYDEPRKHVSEKLARVLGEEKLRHLLNIPRERNSPVGRILKDLYGRDYENAPRMLKRLGVRPHTHLYNRIMQEIVLRTKHGDVFGPSKHHNPYETESDKTEDLIFLLRELNRKNDDGLRYHSITGPRSVESLESSRVGSHRSNNALLSLLQRLGRRHSTKEYSPLDEILLTAKKPREPMGSHGAIDSSKTQEVIDALLDYSRQEPSPDRTPQLGKEITKALLRSSRGPIHTHGTDGRHLSKLVSVQGTSRTEARPHGLTESREIYTKYHTSNLAAPSPIPISPALAPGIEFSRQTTQQVQPAVLGYNSVSANSNVQPSFLPYTQVVSQPFYSTGGSSVPDQDALLNRQFAVSTSNLYASPQAQPATTMMTGIGGYSGYATMPTSAASFSQYATQPYYLGTNSLYAGHPHYVVEGHEAPGTRWQLKVWRHRPGVSYVSPGVNSFQSSHLGSVVTRARETVTRGLQSGTQPSQFGFATYGPSVFGTTSQYVVRAPDGRIVLTRQPQDYGSPTQGAPTSSVVVSQTTKQVTKTASGAALPAISGGLSGSSFQSAVEGASSMGATKSESLSELTKNKESNLFKSTASDSGSEKTESSFSSDGSSSSSLQAEADLSQSKLRR